MVFGFAHLGFFVGAFALLLAFGDGLGLGAAAVFFFAGDFFGLGAVCNEFCGREKGHLYILRKDIHS